MQKYTTWILAFAGILLYLGAIPPIGFGLLGWLAFAPWIPLIRERRMSGRHPYAVIYLAGFLFWMVSLHWLRYPHPATSIGWIALSGYLAVYFPILVAISRAAVHRFRIPAALAMTIIWTGLELARAHLITGFLMASLAHSQLSIWPVWGDTLPTAWLPIVQIADLAGEYLVTMLLVLVGGTLGELFHHYVYIRYLGERCSPTVASSALDANKKHTATESPLKKPSLEFTQNTQNKTDGDSHTGVANPSEPSWSHETICGKTLCIECCLTILCVTTAWCYGGYAISRQIALKSTTVRVAAIQGSIPSEIKHSPDPNAPQKILEEYLSLTRDALLVPPEERPQLVVWPETMFPHSLLVVNDSLTEADFAQCDASRFCNSLNDLKSKAEISRQMPAEMARRFAVPMLIGMSVWEYSATGTQNYNAAVLFDEMGNLRGMYCKMHRVLFGEYIPFADIFPVLQNLTPLPTSLDPGKKAVRLGCPATSSTPAISIIPNICYESVLPHFIRGQFDGVATAKGRRDSPPMLVANLTNDGWFRGSCELDQHLACAQMRAIEMRVPWIIAANTGFSATISDTGKLLTRGPRAQSGIVTASFHLSQTTHPTVYQSIGDGLPLLCLALTLACGGIGLVRSRMRDPHHSDDHPSVSQD